ncbi:MAG TPA: hypothetical protein VLA31_08330, partial [Burkholderiaceae bacterium]|nr:hypothetical protein [Burkholderiaceae bacterium]
LVTIRDLPRLLVSLGLRSNSGVHPECVPHGLSTYPNLAKTNLYWPLDCPPPACLLAIAEDFNLDVMPSADGPLPTLGGVLGLPHTDPGKREWARSVVDKAKPILDLLEDPRFPAQLLALVTSQTVNQTTGYLSRVAPPDVVQAALRVHDERLQGLAARRLLGQDLHELPPEARTQITLSKKVGGLGLTPATDISPAAFLAAAALAVPDSVRTAPERIMDGDAQVVLPYEAAVLDCVDQLAAAGVRAAPGSVLEPNERGQLNLQEIMPSSQSLQDSELGTLHALGQFHSPAANDSGLKLQRAFMRSRNDHRYRQLMQSHDQAGRLRFESLSGPGAGLAFTINPGWDQAMAISNEELVDAARVRFGLPPRGVQGLQRCLCGARLDDGSVDLTQHPLNCVNMRRRQHRHDRLVHSTAALSRLSGVAATVEPRPESYGPRLRADLACTTLSGRVLTDITVRNPLAPTHMRNSVDANGRSTVRQQAEQQKINKYREMAQREGARFYPLVLTVYGSMGKMFTDFLAILTTDAVRNGIVSERQSPVYRLRLAARLQVELLRGNAHAITRWIKECRDLQPSGGGAWAPQLPAPAAPPAPLDAAGAADAGDSPPPGPGPGPAAGRRPLLAPAPGQEPPGPTGMLRPSSLPADAVRGALAPNSVSDCGTLPLSSAEEDQTGSRTPT